jgi:hypothetical protein
VRDAKKKRPAYLLIGILAITLLVCLVVEVSVRISRRRAEQLLHDLRQLQVGKSTFEDARALIMGFGGGISPYDHSGCSPAHCTFEVVLTHYPPLVRVWGPSLLNGETTWQVVRVFPPLGLQDWQAGATVQVDRGIVTHVSYGVWVRGSGGFVLGRDTDEFLVIPQYLRDRMGQRSYYVSWANITTVGGGEGILSTLTPQANAEERNHAYDVDFDCLTMLGGCTSLCQIAPTSFADLVKDSHQMPWLDEHDPHCAKFKPLERSLNGAPNP